MNKDSEPATVACFRRSDLRIAFLLFLVAAFTFIYFKHSFNDVNAVVRACLSLAIVEDGSFAIDRFEHLTIDKSFYNGHYYCDKAPGTSFLAVPFVAAGYCELQRQGRSDFSSPDLSTPTIRINDNFEYLLILASLPISLICAAAVSGMYLLAREFGSERKTSLLCALLLGFGTPFGAWATVLYGHSAAASLLLLGLTTGVGTANHGNGFTVRLRRRLWILTGFLLAYAVLTEYTAAVPACLIGVFLLGGPAGVQKGVRAAASLVGLLAIGVLPVAVLFLFYHATCFGSPFSLGYRFVAGDFPEMRRGFFGLNIPDLFVLLQTLFSPKHGILAFSPFMIFSPILAVKNIQEARHPGLNMLALLIAVYYFLLNSSYAYWYASIIPCRHATAAFPFLVIPFLSGWNREKRHFRIAVNISMILSLLFSVAALAAPSHVRYEALWATDHPSIDLVVELLRGKTASNLGGYIRPNMSAHLTLIPACMAWCLFGLLFFTICRQSDETQKMPEI